MATESAYIVVREPTPVFNTPEIKEVFGGSSGDTLGYDSSGLVRALEFIALPGTVFRVEKFYGGPGAAVCKVKTEEYPEPPDKGLFLDTRFDHAMLSERPSERPKELPAMHKIISGLLDARGEYYIWGGNYRSGVPKMLEFYPSRATLSPRLRAKWTFDGVDCSGLLYDATGGYTPRNTSMLLSFGVSVPVEGLGLDEIISKLKPLDLIVWKGHVIVVIDAGTVIQSKLSYDKPLKGRYGGVRLSSARSVLKGLLAERVPLNDHHKAVNTPEKYFVVRRWYGV
ncbi:MAG: peptidoglycan endopeptidase [Candidatus Omnitrophica bacterium]|nr:peptidoglycan endopeptidase [Candidatus Omnitrophota bacterium]